ncbi:Membrane protease subunit, stomatin/prohibitin family, contains C-terminal Zn-ribbon domain [Tenacibaculum sp. MAR_2009_124]|uniref:SPFH domain-containing protein n=1 Tax=Tenacibaculum sp. MAR_2009_124 TaxID=1250059 RepID=UPI000899D389|nr:SPFH domain-containing protein [Tenacibaculum sp. MAR_2009_124]SEC35201.1 Membrane protease subunit, stomatin/prohibitin family, contains C-terminal Zn-ribbon domain [Tenacibaculum sp. MAR_2009_124]
MEFKAQFKSVIQWNDPQPDELFIKITEDGEEVKNASKLIIQPGQGCIITYEGKIEGHINEEGIYDLKTGNKPFITSIKNFLSLKDKSEHVLELWFYRKADVLNMRWGTRSPIAYKDPVYTFPILLSAFGNYSIRINKPQWFFENVIAGQERYYHHDLKEVFLSRMLQPMTDYLANAKFSYVDIDSNLNTIAKETRDKTSLIFDNLGFEVLDFRIEGTRFDQDTLDRIAKISDVQAEVKAAEIAGINYTEHQQLQAMRDAANNQAGGSGLIMATNAGLMANEIMNQTKENSNQLTSPVEKLKELKELFEMELINEQEYAEKKKAILDSM